MKRRTFAAGLFLALSVLLLWAAASGGDAGDPLASLSYLEGSYSDTLNSRVEEKLNESDQVLLKSAGEGASDMGSVASEASVYADVWTETMLKEGDFLSGSTGFCFLPLAGALRVDYDGAAVVDVTSGSVAPSGGTLSVSHRYLVAEDTSATFSVTSPTAVVEVQGSYALSLSGSVDYNAMARALKTLHLFRGSYTAYGQGFDLDKAPTRLQALIMFIRVLGEEDAALAWSGTTPFTDLTRGSDGEKYVGYAYERGYTNGYTATAFRPGQTVSANQYTEFVLRALGYSSIANTDLSNTLRRATDCGLLTEGEAAALGSGSFLRAHLVYISCQAVDTVTASGPTLGDHLMEMGVYTFAEEAEARALVNGAGRLD